MKMRATIKNGKIVIDRQLWEQYLKTFNGEVSIEIKPWKKDRTLDQNALYWKYIEIICSETGDNIDDMHEFLKRKLLPPRFTKVMGQNIKLPATTTKLNTKEFGEYLEKICALTQIPIPNYA